MKTQGTPAGQWLTIASSPYFLVEKGVVAGPWALSTTPESFVILVVAEGEGSLKWNDGEIALRAGECFLLPATLGSYELNGNMTVLRSTLP
ncbi:hypothetical protein PACILC2_48180 [Paenibacillus cisolokensis]|uniref:Phosphohexomutase n=1 Tax=Paenibacillus cisolokensis TaxID=1658519 RepID=A0ABQ4NDJ5_9BACL|nr:hypothetical protein PACILC2_48180 [Paenibacillus cisolokensis]